MGMWIRDRKLGWTLAVVALGACGTESESDGPGADGSSGGVATSPTTGDSMASDSASTGLAESSTGSSSGAPFAEDDGPFTTPQGVALDVAPLANDVDGASAIDPATLTFFDDGVLAGSPWVTDAGTWMVINAGDVRFEPAVGFTGATSVQYRVADSDGNVSNAATIGVTVTAGDSSGACECYTCGGGDNCCSYWGNAYYASGPSNISLQNDTQLGLPFVAKADGNITDFSFNMKYDNSVCASSGNPYSCGDHGNIRACIHEASPVDGAPVGEAIACRVILDPTEGGRPDSPGAGNLGKWALDEPAPVVAGQAYALVVDNVHPDPANNFSSVNVMYIQPNGDVYDDAEYREIYSAGGFFGPIVRNSSYWDGGAGGEWGRADTLRYAHTSAFEVYYEGGERQGQSYVGARFGTERDLAPGNGQIFRQLMTPPTEKTVTRIHVRGRSQNGGSTLRATIRDESDVALSEVVLQPSGEYWLAADLPSPLNLQGGQQYKVDVAGESGSIQFRPMYHANFPDEGWVSDGQSDWADSYLQESTDGGSSFSNYFGGTIHDISLFFSTECLEDPGTGGNVETVYYGGHSLMSPPFSSEADLATAPSGMENVGVLSQSGASASAAYAGVAAAADDWVDADAVVFDYIINGDESAAEFVEDARALNDLVRSQHPEAKLVWVEGHACSVAGSTGALPYVQARWMNKNGALQQMLNDGEIDAVVPWAEYAAANGGGFYVGDCVHHSDKSHYAGEIQAVLDTL